MCGIVGIINPEASQMIERSTDMVSHRGPDDKGIYTFENLAFGHRRLAIMDLNPLGHQPMTSKDGRYTILFNGEIYNHLELRKEILPDFEFKGTSDTETILYAYIKIGEHLFPKLNGIFALAIFDNHSKELIIVRDQFGIKPLYFYHKEGNFYFASELKSLLGLNIDKSIDHNAFSHYLYFLYSPGEQTPFLHVKKMKPGHVIRFNIENPSAYIYQQFYDIPFEGKYTDKSQDELVKEVDAHLTKALERQLLSDVPVGFFLSGGLDSSAMVALARKLYPDKKINTYTIDTGGGFDGFEDDLKYAKIVAKHLNVELDILKTEIDVVKDFDKMIWHLDEPQADAAPLNVLAICERAREKGDVVLLGGTAGDDLFSGYRRHQALNYEGLFRSVPGIGWKMANSLLNVFPAQNSFIRRSKKLIADAHLEADERIAKYFGWINHIEIIELFNDDLKESIRKEAPHQLLMRTLQDIPQEKNELNKMLYLEMKYFLTDHNLNYTDKMSMAHGVEVRVPFLDLDLVNFSTTIPPQFKMKGNETKYILKKTMEKYLPKEVIYRKKTGFGAPVRKWITKDLSKMIEERLSEDSLAQWGIFDYKKVHKLIEKNKSGQIDASYTIWALLAIQSWLNQFCK